MSSENGQNGPTTVHPAINYNDLAAHMQINGMQNGLNGLNGMNGLGMLGNNQKYERGEEKLSTETIEMKSNFN